MGNTVRDAGTNFLSVEAWTSDNADRLSHGRLRRLLANESRLRRPERRRCVLTVPTWVEISPQFSAAAAADGRVAEATVEVFHVVTATRCPGAGRPGIPGSRGHGSKARPQVVWNTELVPTGFRSICAVLRKARMVFASRTAGDRPRFLLCRNRGGILGPTHDRRDGAEVVPAARESYRDVRPPMAS